MQGGKEAIQAGKDTIERIPGRVMCMLMQDSGGDTAIQTVYLASTAADGRLLFWDYTFVLTYDRCCLCNVIVGEKRVFF